MMLLFESSASQLEKTPNINTQNFIRHSSSSALMWLWYESRMLTRRCSSCMMGELWRIFISHTFLPAFYFHSFCATLKRHTHAQHHRHENEASNLSWHFLHDNQMAIRNKLCTFVSSWSRFDLHEMRVEPFSASRLMRRGCWNVNVLILIIIIVAVSCLFTTSRSRKLIATFAFG